MKKLIFFWLPLVTMATWGSNPQVKAQGTFQKTYGGGTGYCVKNTLDGNLAVTGESNGNTFLLKMDQNGTILWYKNYATTAGTIEGKSVVATADGGYIITGTLNPGAPTSDVLLLKTDSNGNFSWSKTYGGLMDESGAEVKQTLDGGYVIVGSTRSFGTNFDDIYVVKTDSNGNLQWSKDIADSPTDYVDYGKSIIQNADSSYTVCGMMANSVTSSDATLVKLSKNGSLVWVKSYGETGNDEGNSVISTSDGGYAVVGYFTNSSGDWDVLLVKTNSTGSLQWNITYGGSGYETGRSVIQMPNGNYVVAGGTNSFGNGAGEFYLTQFDPNQIFLWTKTFGGVNFDDCFAMSMLNNNSFFTVGLTQSFGPWDIYVTKTNLSGYSGCNEFTPNMSMTLASVTVTTPSVVISTPSTAVNSLTFTASNVSTVNTLCSLVTVQEIVEPFDLDNHKPEAIYNMQGQPVIESTDLPHGIYIYKYDVDNKRYMKKKFR